MSSFDTKSSNPYQNTVRYGVNYTSSHTTTLDTSLLNTTPNQNITKPSLSLFKKNTSIYYVFNTSINYVINTSIKY
jgi:hypothetical protein